MLPPHLHAYFEFSQKLFTSSETTLKTHKKGQKDMVSIDVKGSFQMEIEESNLQWDKESLMNLLRN
jgi:hypothetical protein